MLDALRRAARNAYHLLLIGYAAALGAGLGLGSALWVLEGDYPFGERRAQAWLAWPSVGSPQSDPYARAILARSADVPLALGEGIAFHAYEDELGRPLDARCRYAISGETPVARAWTLTLYDPDGRLIETPQRRPGLTSAEVLRAEDGAVTIALAPDPQPGNWIQLPGSGGFQAVLRLYDSPVSGALGWLDDGAMPRIVRLSCTGEATS
ncbi:DUF1214 domain-containing protein [Salinarimonas ramus]|uniref:Membrane protein n=1 Tax=Salinarimonas ramus TaxID=690164 RepID=A0A917Q2T9_9HYPH|nr:DUF1214 domain-containing protein [Salinarimonas ramus]GGK17416.1 membrane protein [Salinarimonas ramus]